MVKPSCSDMQKAVWVEDDDEKTVAYASKHHGSAWQRRSGKCSRERWSSSQKTDPKHQSFTPREEELVIQLHATIGSRWPIIAQQLPGKTDTDVKILWNSKLRKRLSAMGIDPVTHKPFSQILADYGNIGAFPKARTRFTSLSRDLKNAIMLKPEPHSHPKIGLSDNQSLQLYSQLQAVNLVSETSNFAKTEEAMIEQGLNHEISSFNWSDFFLEDAFMASNGAEDEFMAPNRPGDEGKTGFGGDEDKNGAELGNGSFEASSSSNSSSFVEAMIGGQDDHLFSQLPCFYEDPFYY